MSTFPGEPPMAAEHRRTYAQQTAPPPPAPRRSSARTARRRHREHVRRQEALFEPLGSRFASWALRQGYQPVDYGSVGRGWKIGTLRTGGSRYVSDPGPGEARAMLAGPPNWYVLHTGQVTTSSGTEELLSERGTGRFIKLVLANWGCNLDSSPDGGTTAAAVTPDHSTWLAGEGLQGNPGLSQFEQYLATRDSSGYPDWPSPTLVQARPSNTRHRPRRQSWWQNFLDLL